MKSRPQSFSILFFSLETCYCISISTVVILNDSENAKKKGLEDRRVRNVSFFVSL